MDDQQLDALLRTRSTPVMDAHVPQHIIAEAARTAQRAPSAAPKASWRDAFMELCSSVSLAPRPAAMALSLTLLIGVAVGYANSPDAINNAGADISATSEFLYDEGEWQ